MLVYVHPKIYPVHKMLYFGASEKIGLILQASSCTEKKF